MAAVRTVIAVAAPLSLLTARALDRAPVSDDRPAAVEPAPVGAR